MPVRILVVEDDAAARELIREHLAADATLEIIAETPSGKEAVRLAVEHRPDLVLMDLAVKDQDGLKASREIAKRCPTASVLVLTNYAFEDLRARSQEMYGIAGFLSKQEIPTRLLAMVRSLAKKKPEPPPARK